MYYYDKYSRPDLDAACKDFLEHQVNNLQVHTAIPLLHVLEHFGVQDLRGKCVEWMANNSGKFSGYAAQLLSQSLRHLQVIHDWCIANVCILIGTRPTNMHW